MNKADCYIAFAGKEATQKMVEALNTNALTNRIFVISPEKIEIPCAEILMSEHPHSSETIRQIAGTTTSPFALLLLNETFVLPGQYAVERIIRTAENTGASMVYADYREVKNGTETLHPVIDYQQGSLRDDFNFGPAQLFRTEVLKSFDEEDFGLAGYYALQLHASREALFCEFRNSCSPWRKPTCENQEKSSLIMFALLRGTNNWRWKKHAQTT